MNWLTLFIRFSRLTFYTALLLGSAGIAAISITIFIVAKDLPKLPEPLSRIIETPKTEIYASTGERLITLGGREPVLLSRISPHFINAVLAVEDHMFQEHFGVNKLRTLKALYVTLMKPGRIEGASTITQQLAKNLFFSFERTYLRKFKEMLVAFQIEYSCTKEEILQAYVNQIAFGAGAQGVEKAAQVFFGKSAAQLTLGEAALLAGLPKSPTNYNPYRHYDRALKRRDVVIRRMKDAGYITQTQVDEVVASKPTLHKNHADARTGSYFLDAIIAELVQKYGSDVVYHGGIKVTASIDANMQDIATRALQQGMENLDKLMGLKPDDEPRPQGALVAIDTASGAVKAMAGGRDYYKSEYNRAIYSRRQPGSGFKPFLYYTACEKLNIHGGTLMVDSPVSIPVVGAPVWQPGNFERTFRGPVILKQALTHSINTIAAKLVHKTGPDAVINTARLCGIKSPLQSVYSVALGTSVVTPIEMASAYSTIASGGIKHEPFLIWRVEDAFGRVIYEHLVRGKKVLDPDITFQVIDMMKSVIDNGSGRSIRASGFTRPAAGKTGTTDSYNDAWFTGFTPSLCTSVWTGFDRERKLRQANGLGITGGRSAAPIWAQFMEEALKNQPPRDFIIPDGIHFEEAVVTTGYKFDRKKRPQINVTESDLTESISQSVNPGYSETPESKPETMIVPLKPNQQLRKLPIPELSQ
ncbi:Membrane carboxypeptidase (Penicillin-binding protein) [Desulfamplus magnetovallimortis]|uniref:Membrane carboxypeptidase (Penicillin-binding protein) n=1 Tax=Desulfamplus magnetovallimortis TaxID=1246637 RepID=A0A1W1HFY9_9BACT|nr:PBP1A family penicillin-binding protein [Desulfamplus magnetovallimortis]SLM31315.1 Membrane carboxypeptidase (Penicillin-binding protein) [Desulfamplus magnetovallimortis]